MSYMYDIFVKICIIDIFQVLEETLERIEDSFTCCVCRDAEISAALCPCGHLTCIECAKKLSDCPLCRKQIERVQRIFLPTIQCKGAACASISLQTVTKSPGHRHCHKRKREAYMDVLETPESWWHIDWQQWQAYGRICYISRAVCDIWRGDRLGMGQMGSAGYYNNL